MKYDLRAEKIRGGKRWPLMMVFVSVVVGVAGFDPEPIYQHDDQVRKK
ncbi:hypothetical protein HanXRQr2_Chr09g0399871 [Helianthus annuus]|uniref:Uncharacterized protein n=1 Tax=Helianthus annuus TaxID=4232 RepID=A0A9K3N9F4_HELAN|nr:hypothetical protein HanXRQr2_Chr09g0399871 [Helianthus annuus]KAJ0894128.1 hypothetical protein HanPSC8_Chr09g0385621 [Helianthus annuus]